MGRVLGTDLDRGAFLVAQQGYSLFKATGDLIHRDPTGTDINDIRAF